MKRELIIDELYERGYEASKVDVTKNGVVLKGIRLNNGEISPTIYTEQYEDYDNVGMVVDEIIKAYEEALNSMPTLDMSNIMDWEYVKTRLKLCIQRQGNEDIVKRNFLDLEQYVRVCVSEEATYKVIPEHLKKFGINEETLFHAAWECTKPTFTAMDMIEIMAEMMGIDAEELREMSKDSVQIVITNKSKTNGATAMCDHELLDEIAKKYKADLVILPSSIHECIVIPFTTGMVFEDFNMMVKEVNETQVDPVEQLSDHAYYYDGVMITTFAR